MISVLPVMISLSVETAPSALNLIAIGTAFLTGFIFSFSPILFTAIPLVLAYVTHARQKKQAMIYSLAFVAGLVLTHAILGIAAALGGDWVKSVMGREWGLVLGPIFIILGLSWAGWIHVSLPGFGMRAKKVSGLWGAFILGVPFSIAICPLCTPALLVVLTSSAASGSVFYGLALLVAFALGRSLPILIGAWSMRWLESLQSLARYQQTLEKIAGSILIITGLYLINEYYLWVGY